MFIVSCGKFLFQALWSMVITTI